jgi:hypothetical protein
MDGEILAEKVSLSWPISKTDVPMGLGRSALEVIMNDLVFEMEEERPGDLVCIFCGKELPILGDCPCQGGDDDSR